MKTKYAKISYDTNLIDYVVMRQQEGETSMRLENMWSFRNDFGYLPYREKDEEIRISYRNWDHIDAPF